MTSKKSYTAIFNPTDKKGFILPDRIMSQFEGGIDNHQLFYGGPGTGKSSFAKLLASKHPYLYINMSEEGRIETIRDTLTDFITGVQIHTDESIDDSIKVIIFDEFEGASIKVHEAIRGFMDKYESVAKFIATTNYIGKITDPVISRFNCVNFDPETSHEEAFLKTKYKARINSIVTKYIKKTIEPEAVDFLIKANFPGFRSLYQSLQRLSKLPDVNITIDHASTKSFEFSEVYDMIIKGGNPVDIHKKMESEYSARINDVFTSLENGFVSYIEVNKQSCIPAIPNLIILNANYQDKASRCINPMIALKALIFELMIVFEKYRK